MLSDILHIAGDARHYTVDGEPKVKKIATGHQGWGVRRRLFRIVHLACPQETDKIPKATQKKQHQSRDAREDRCNMYVNSAF